MPRKAARPLPPRAAAKSFNEAGAVMPRKDGRTESMDRLNWQASMRPGLLCPGKVRQQNRRRKGAQRFNEAGAVMPRKDCVGKVPMAAEAASMRPGLLCPGKGLGVFCRP